MSCGPQSCFDKGADTALAVGACHMDCLKAVLWITQPF